ncbi:MAG TPA: prolipoprotein diacylglyceryl transferase family protein [Kofleriaceae bacterium]|nr:prolipoprotein diacylglyceryl transferase family protein [Kofleriaceae bacterium]
MIGYAIANLIGSALAVHWKLTLGERLVSFFVPPLAFVAVVTVSSAIAGYERIVFYRTTVAGIASVAVLGEVIGARSARLVDLVTLGIGIFLVFGRLGCHAVACCHGTLGRGVTYGPPHVAVGFSPRWSDRELWPVQLGEAIASGALVLAGLACSAEPGQAALVYALGYAVVRFILELVRGDGMRPYLLGVSEAQWIAVASALSCAAWRPGIVTCTIAAGLVAAAGTLIARRHRRELLLPGHRCELEQALVAADSGERRETSLGVVVSHHVLPDGRTDWVLSSEHRYWSAATARSLAHLLWPSFELLPGHTPNVFHVLTT